MTDHLTTIADPNLTHETALALSETGWWKLYPPRDVALAQLRQERLCMPFDEFQRLVVQVIGGPVFTHELAYPEKLIERIESGRKGGVNPFVSLAEVKLRRTRSGLWTVRGQGRRYRTKALALRSCLGLFVIRR
jgi:hypothetical protein